MEVESCVPPGFRFHPTEEELVGYYLMRKVHSLKIDLDVIVDLDLYRMEPWDIEDRCKLGYEEQSEWYFFSHKDRKYPTGTRTNRATSAGFWKATGRDKAVLSKTKIVGMRKTLVFYEGRAPSGCKTDWIMHEYRLQTSEHGPPQASLIISFLAQEEGWVVCRAFKKPTPNQKQGFEAWNNSGYCFRSSGNFWPPSIQHTSNLMYSICTNRPAMDFRQSSTSNQDLVDYTRFDNQLVDLPQLDSPTLSTCCLATMDGFELTNLTSTEEHDQGWKNVDNLPALEQIQQPPFSYSKLPLIPRDDELDSQSHLSHLLGYFPDL
ncbi:hypothetical protein RJ639_031776 [Escallonia herrerae]|uniref:NAC domain-containing protein n=1 Tax=Escallonia herrerae TaxID=1293975 RepID=A0AA88X0R8_9ASTE|nr:hypothetical protein RJ639_031776 [Escallonia herrerae]